MTSSLRVHFAPSHNLRKRQIILVVELGVFVQAEICEALAFFVAPSDIESGVSWLDLRYASRIALQEMGYLRFFAFLVFNRRAMVEDRR